MALSAKGMSLPGRASRPSVAARAHPASRDVALAVVLLSASPALAIDASAYDALAKGYRREPVRLEVAVEAKTPASSPVAVEVSEAPSLDVPEPQPELPPVDFALPEDPLVLAAGGAGAAFVAGGAAFLAFRSKGSAVKTLDSSKAFELLKAKPEAVLVDVRSLAEAKKTGSPDLRQLRKSPEAIPFTKLVKGKVVPAEQFVTSLKRRVKPDTVVVILDNDGKLARQAAEAAVKEAGVTQVVCVSGGAEAWKSAGVPWKEPFTFSLPSVDLKNIKSGMDNLAEDFKASPTLTKGGLALGALAGAGFVLFNEMETVMELIGSIAIARLAFTRLLFADTRRETVGAIQKVGQELALDEAGQDLKKVAKALLDEGSKSTASEVPSKAENKPESKVENKVESKVESKAESKAESKMEDKAESKTEDKVVAEEVEEKEAVQPSAPVVASFEETSESFTENSKSLSERKEAAQRLVQLWKEKALVTV